MSASIDGKPPRIPSSANQAPEPKSLPTADMAMGGVTYELIEHGIGTEDDYAAMVVNHMRMYVDMTRALGPGAAAGHRKSQKILKDLRKHMARLDLDAGREYARRHGIVLPLELEEMNS